MSMSFELDMLYSYGVIEVNIAVQGYLGYRIQGFLNPMKNDASMSQTER